MDVYIAADIGGTQIRAAVYPADGKSKAIISKRIATTGAGSPPEDRLVGLIASIPPEGARVLGVGVAAPGFLDTRLGIIYESPNIPGWDDFPLRQILEDRLRVPVQLGNDANMAALGEWRYGAGQGHHNLIYLTISTGIGGGVILDDRLLLGEHGLAAEVGHITMQADGLLCGCGGRGHLESLGSGTAIARYVAEQLAMGEQSDLLTGPAPDTRQIAEAAKKGDPLALRSIQLAGRYIGYAVADFLALFNPSIIIFGGGVSSSGELLLQPVRQAMEERVISPAYTRGLVITQAALGDDAGLVGALALIQDHVQA